MASKKSVMMQVVGSGLPKVAVHKVKFPKKTLAPKAFKKKLAQSIAPKAPPPPSKTKVKIKAVPLTASRLKNFFSVGQAENSAAAIDKLYKKDIREFIGCSHTILTTIEYVKMRDEYKTRRALAKTAAAKKKLDKQWKEVLGAASAAGEMAGGKQLSQGKLDEMAKLLLSNKKNYAEALKISQSGKKGVAGVLSSSSVANAVVVATSVADVAPAANAMYVLSDLCDSPIQGAFTQQYSASFDLVVRYTVWCPTWTKPWRTCRRSITLAGIGVNMGINVGYRVTCCGASVWGSGYVNACGTVIGITKCAGCRATVAAVGGVGRTPISGGQCSYGLGAVANITCSIGGITVFSATYSFGWTINGPCPPKQLPC